MIQMQLSFNPESRSDRDSIRKILDQLANDDKSYSSHMSSYSNSNTDVVLQDKESEITSLKEKNKVQETQIEELNNKITRISNDIEEAQKRYNELQDKYDKLYTDNQELSFQNRKLNAEVSSYNDVKEDNTWKSYKIGKNPYWLEESQFPDSDGFLAKIDTTNKTAIFKFNTEDYTQYNKLLNNKEILSPYCEIIEEDNGGDHISNVEDGIAEFRDNPMSLVVKRQAKINIIK